MKIILTALIAVAVTVVAFAQDAAATGAESVMTNLTGLSTQQQLYVTQAVIIFKLLSELYGAVRSGGGLKRILMSFWLGDTVPRAIADDYKQELSNPPFTKPGA